MTTNPFEADILSRIPQAEKDEDARIRKEEAKMRRLQEEDAARQAELAKRKDRLRLLGEEVVDLLETQNIPPLPILVPRKNGIYNKSGEGWHIRGLRSVSSRGEVVQSLRIRTSQGERHIDRTEKSQISREPIDAIINPSPVSVSDGIAFLENDDTKDALAALIMKTHRKQKEEEKEEQKKREQQS